MRSRPDTKLQAGIALRTIRQETPRVLPKVHLAIDNSPFEFGFVSEITL